MAVSQLYYLNGTSLSDSTAVFTDDNLTTCAPDGFYSDGVIVREQVGCVLLPQQICPSCSTPCGILASSVGVNGVFLLASDMDAATGAIVITFNPFDTPVGFQAIFDGTVYNTFSSPVYGLQSIGSSDPIYLGSSSVCDLPAISPITLDKYQYDGTNYINTTTTESVSVTYPQMTGDVSPGDCVIVIPKTAATPSIVDIYTYAACEGATFNLSVQCPTSLREFASSLVVPLESLVCEATIDQTYYVAHVNGVDTVLGLYDWVFSDINGEFILTDGYYKSTNCPDGYAYFQVANGIIINFADCL